MSVSDVIETLQNKVLRIASHRPWYIRNSEIREEFDIETITNYVTKLSKYF